MAGTETSFQMTLKVIQSIRDLGRCYLLEISRNSFCCKAGQSNRYDTPSCYCKNLTCIIATSRLRGRKVTSRRRSPEVASIQDISSSDSQNFHLKASLLKNLHLQAAALPSEKQSAPFRLMPFSVAAAYPITCQLLGVE
jgi:hypothetical protein